MKSCQACKKTAEGARVREVELDGVKTALCAACGRIEFVNDKGEKASGLLVALNQPRRPSHGGKSVTFHSEKPLLKGDLLREAAGIGMPKGTLGFPSKLVVGHVRPLVTVETIPQPAAPAEG
ncbi:MAG: hypothetical protein MUC63_11055, partial [Planctomycetes bacterium]|nr:hypothetical protein [Planctomycetota bacterium]